MAHFRRGSMFVRDPREHSKLLDRNQAARTLYLAEALEVRTKTKGARNGCLGLTGLAVLRALVLRFQNRSTGLCCPSYDALQEATGLCRQTIARALERLAAAGIVSWTRRIVREVVDGILVTRQASNLYRMQEPTCVPMIASAKPRGFPQALARLLKMPAPRAEYDRKGVTIDQNLTGRELHWDRSADWRARARQSLAIKARVAVISRA